MLRLWLLCCGVMFVVSQGYEWASHQAWFGTPHLSLPWLILGGIGLAISSNRAELKSLTSTTASPQAFINEPTALAPTTAAPTAMSEPTSEPVPEAVPPQCPQIQTPKASSISFEINAQQRPRA